MSHHTDIDWGTVLGFVIMAVALVLFWSCVGRAIT